MLLSRQLQKLLVEAFPNLTVNQENISFLIYKLSYCFENSGCSRGFVLGTSSSKIRFIENGPYFDLLMKIKSLINTGSSNIQNEQYTHKFVFDLMSKDFNIYVGFREGNYFITSRQAFIDIRETDITIFPFLFYYSHPIIMSYLKLIKSLEASLPKRIDDCSFHANRTGCYMYQGSSECIFNYVSRCPLRILLRKSKSGLGGAISTIDKALMTVNRYQPSDFQSTENYFDYLLTKILLEILNIVAWKTSIETAKLMGVKVDLKTSIFDIRAHVKSIPAPKIRRAFNYLLNSLESIIELNDPYQARTRIILFLESLPKFMRIISEYASFIDMYSFCRQSFLDERVIKGLIEYYYPFIKGKISESISKEIKSLLLEDGCIEPREISKEISEELAFKVLEVLSQKNILKKVIKKGRPIFVGNLMNEQNIH